MIAHLIVHCSRALVALVAVAAAIAVQNLGMSATVHVPGDFPTIQAAITAAAPGSEIQIAAGAYFEHIVIEKDLTLIGNGLVTTFIDGNNEAFNKPLVQIAPFVSVSMKDLCVRRGRLEESVVGGAGINNRGTLILNRCVVRENTAIGGIYGGGIANGGHIMIVDSAVEGNSAHSAGGILAGGTVVISNSVFRSNDAWFEGGGILLLGSLEMDGSTVAGNGAEWGGGLWVSGNAVISNSTISGNGAGVGEGGGIANVESGTATLVNCTISGNAVFFSPHPGTAIQNSAVMNLVHCTVVENFFAYTEVLQYAIGNSGTLNMRNTIVANNLPADYSGPLNSQGYNLIENTAGALIAGDTIGNLYGVDPLVGPLADNGGPTQTHALLAGSPALDAAICVDGAGAVLFDQRAVSRPQGIRCDIGSFELEAPIDSTPPTVVIHQIISGPPTQLLVRVADVGSGLASIQVVKVVNANVTVPPFDPGTLGPIYPVATKIDQTKSAFVELLVTDVAGNSTRGDPVITTLALAKGGWIAQRFTEIPEAERYITIQNGSDGLKKATIRVNETTWMVHLRDNQTGFIDASSAMIGGDNNVVDLVGHGPPGANALIVIADSPVELLQVVGEANSSESKGKINQVNLVWGRLAAESRSEPVGIK